jgi:hypothetical protein
MLQSELRFDTSSHAAISDVHLRCSLREENELACFQQQSATEQVCCYEDLLLKFNELWDMVTLLVNSKESGGTRTIGEGAHMRSPILRSVSTMSSSTSVDQAQVSAVSQGGKKKAAAAANGSLAPSPKSPKLGKQHQQQ